MSNKEQKEKSSEAELTLWEHVGVLRRYVLFSVLAILFFGSVTHAFRAELVELLLRPLGTGVTLQFLSPLDPLLFILTLDLMGGVLLSLPVILWSVYRFLTPALPVTKTVWVWLTLITGIVLGIAAVTYGYLLAVPLTLSVLTSITLPGTEAAFTAKGYLSFLSTVLIMLVLVFELPLMMVLLARLGVLNIGVIRKKRAYIYLGLLITVAVITPTADVISLGLILLPTYAVFEIGLAGSALVTQKEKKE